MSAQFLNPGPQRKEIDNSPGPLVLEFGTDWCGYCLAAEPLAEAAFSTFPQIKLIKVEDGPGRKLGRSFRVKLWPTFVFLKEGTEQARVVRPESIQELTEQLKKL